MTSTPPRTLEQAQLELKIAELELENLQLKQKIDEDALHLSKLESEADIRNKAVESLANEVERLDKSVKALTKDTDSHRAARDEAWKKLSDITDIAGYGRRQWHEQFGYDTRTVFPLTGPFPFTCQPCGTGATTTKPPIGTASVTIGKVDSKDPEAAMKKIHEISKTLGKYAL